MSSKLINLTTELHKLGKPDKTKLFVRYFKAGPGEYAEGDKFIGVTVPNCRAVAKKYKDLTFSSIKKLLHSKIHEERLVGLLVLVDRFNNANAVGKNTIYKFYLDNTEGVNNWDLVDLSSHKIVGEYLVDKPKDILYRLSKSKNLWEKRISIISTFAFIKRGEIDDTLKIAKLLLGDKHDLIHKAVGWALREVGKKDQKRLESFLKTNYTKLPRTTLRYAIERFTKTKRLRYLKGEF